MRGILGLCNADDYGFDLCGNHKCPGVFGPLMPDTFVQTSKGSGVSLVALTGFGRKMVI